MANISVKLVVLVVYMYKYVILVGNVVLCETNRQGLTSLASTCSPVVPTAAGSPRWDRCHDVVAPV